MKTFTVDFNNKINSVKRFTSRKGPKSVRSDNRRPLIELRCLLLMLVSTLLRIIVNYCFSLMYSVFVLCCLCRLFYGLFA